MALGWNFMLQRAAHHTEASLARMIKTIMYLEGSEPGENRRRSIKRKVNNLPDPGGGKRGHIMYYLASVRQVYIIYIIRRTIYLSFFA